MGLLVPDGDAKHTAYGWTYGGKKWVGVSGSLSYAGAEKVAKRFKRRGFHPRIFRIKAGKNKGFQTALTEAEWMKDARAYYAKKNR